MNVHYQRKNVILDRVIRRNWWQLFAAVATIVGFTVGLVQFWEKGTDNLFGVSGLPVALPEKVLVLKNVEVPVINEVLVIVLKEVEVPVVIEVVKELPVEKPVIVLEKVESLVTKVVVEEVEVRAIKEVVKEGEEVSGTFAVNNSGSGQVPDTPVVIFEDNFEGSEAWSWAAWSGPDEDSQGSLSKAHFDLIIARNVVDRDGDGVAVEAQGEYSFEFRGLAPGEYHIVVAGRLDTIEIPPRPVESIAQPRFLPINNPLFVGILTAEIAGGLTPVILHLSNTPISLLNSFAVFGGLFGFPMTLYGLTFLTRNKSPP